MTNLLLRLFVKNYRDTKNPKVRAAYGKLAGAVGIVCNLLLFAAKLAAGLLSGAVSIVADAVNNLSDASSSLITLLGFRLAERPADDEHPYGHARIEYLTGLAVSALILIIGFELGKSSFEKILHPEEIAFTWLTGAILLSSVAVKLWMYVFCEKLGRRIGSTTLEATAADSRNDVITTGAVLLGCLAWQLWGVRVDGYVGLLVALFIFWSGISIAKDTISPLLGEQASPELVSSISELVLRHEGILGIHDLMVHDYGPGRRFASAHAEVDYRMDILDAHELLDDIERDVRAKLRVDLVLHCDPIVTDDAERNALRGRVLEYLTEQDERLTIHDFRVVRGSGHTNVIFDLVVPFDLEAKAGELKRGLEQALSADGKRYHAIITIDTEAFNGVDTRSGE